jgi:hypothetical protein
LEKLPVEFPKAGGGFPPLPLPRWRRPWLWHCQIYRLDIFQWGCLITSKQTDASVFHLYNDYAFNEKHQFFILHITTTHHHHHFFSCFREIVESLHPMHFSSILMDMNLQSVEQYKASSSSDQSII